MVYNQIVIRKVHEFCCACVIIILPPLPGYQDYVSRLSREARHFLGNVLGDSERYKIAESMLKWEEKFAPVMELTESEIHDIKRGQYRDNHVLQRYFIACQNVMCA